MLHPSLYFPDYPRPVVPSKSVHGDEPQATKSSAQAGQGRENSHRIVLRSGCVLFRMPPPRR